MTRLIRYRIGTWADKVRRFHHNEKGLEAIQVVMIVAIAALFLIAFMVIGDEIVDWLKEKWNELKR